METKVPEVNNIQCFRCHGRSCFWAVCPSEYAKRNYDSEQEENCPRWKRAGTSVEKSSKQAKHAVHWQRGTLWGCVHWKCVLSFVCRWGSSNHGAYELPPDPFKRPIVSSSTHSEQETSSGIDSDGDRWLENLAAFTACQAPERFSVAEEVWQL